MFIEPPVKFEDGTTFKPDGETHRWDKKNGYDSKEKRITNIVGHDGKQFIKKCPHCKRELPETAFGEMGRDTGEGTRRDQSNCGECRARY